MPPTDPLVSHGSGARRHGRRTGILLVTLALGAFVLGRAIRATPGEPAFLGWTALLACVWAVGARWAGPLPAGRLGLAGVSWRRAGRSPSSVLLPPVGVAFVAVALPVASGLLLARIPPLRAWLEPLVDQAGTGSPSFRVALVLVTLLAGIGEELFFRGAVYAAALDRHPVVVSTAVHALVTLVAGNPLLVVAAVVLGVLAGGQRRLSGGVGAPILVHLLWSVGMVVLLPPAVAAWG